MAGKICGHGSPFCSLVGALHLHCYPSLLFRWPSHSGSPSPLQFVTFSCVPNLASPDKLEGLSSCLSILGIDLDSVRLQVQLSIDKGKGERIVTLLESWSSKRFCKQWELESLIGQLHHACKIALQGRTLAHRMINLLCTFRWDDHPLRLNFTWTSLCGLNFSIGEMGSASSWCQNGPPSLIFNFPWMPVTLLRNDLKNDILECLFVEISKPRSTPFVVGTWYRPPSLPPNLYSEFEKVIFTWWFQL